MYRRTFLLLLAVAIGGAGCSRGGDNDEAAEQATATSPPATETAEPAQSPEATPSPAEGTPGPPAPPTPAATAAPRNVNGLMIVDETWVGRVVEPGGLRIRSAPRVETGNVVGSVPDGVLVNVEGRVLNGQEAEPGKGTVWLIVGINQYLYLGSNYVERVP